MNEDEQHSEKRKTIRIHLPRKPAAPRHSSAVVRSFALTRSDDTTPKSLTDGVTLFAIQQAVVLLLGLGMLDGGALFQMVSYASLAYWAGFALMVRRRHKLTRLDYWLIRWGFLILCILSFFLSGMIWSIRGY